MEIRFQLPSVAVEKSILEEFAREQRVEELERARTRLGLLDTFDWRIVRSGHRLFCWEQDDATYLGVHGPSGWLKQPFQVQRAPGFEWDVADWELHATLRSWIKMRRLTQRVELDLNWVRYATLDEEGKQRLRFRFERVRAFAPNDGKRRRLPLALVVEPIKGYENESIGAAAWLAEQFGVLKARQHPFVESLARVGVAPDPFKKRAVPMQRSVPIGIVLGRLLRDSWRVMCLHQQGVLKPDDTEYLHDYRVALRRSRAVLSQLKSAFPAAPQKRFKKEFKRIGDRTGVVRDLDVHLLELEAQLREDGPSSAERIEPLRAVLQQRWKKAQKKLARELKSKRYERLAQEWPAFLETAPDWGGEAQQPALDAASLRIRETYADVVGRGSLIGADTPDDALHQLRLHCKKLRYLLEFFAPLFPAKALEKFVSTLKALQEILGDFNDLFVQRETIHELLTSESSLPEVTREWMSEQASQSPALQAEARKRFDAAFAELARTRTRKQVVKIFGEPSLKSLTARIDAHVEAVERVDIAAADEFDETIQDLEELEQAALGTSEAASQKQAPGSSRSERSAT